MQQQGKKIITKSAIGAFIFSVSIATANAASIGFGLNSTGVNSGEIVEIDLDTGATTVVSSVTMFEPNAAAFDPDALGSGVLYYGDDNGFGLAAWDRATDTHHSLGLLNDVGQGWTDTMSSGRLFDADYWAGGNGIAEGYYVVAAGTDDLFRITFDALGTSIDDVVKVADVASNKYALSFGDIAFDQNGLLHLTTSGLPLGAGLYTYDLVASQLGFAGASSASQIGFGEGGVLYASVLSAGTYGLATIDPSTGAVLTTINTDLGFAPVDFAVAPVTAVPIPAALGLFLPAFAGMLFSSTRRAPKAV